ncbi:hypothetical protein LEP1GSC171_0140 [Leptospira santarosai str. HAI1380]|uniref:Uncharacterized protein n=2 Tax=Leptospira santarosai TaxID=28183 RepID=M6UJ91_9LEPT|nr:hypothetical protein LEP1GSC187_0386 [Leptospira santarosai str. ZUN179]EMP02405.1 hypothetical protein LEP1GSC171_0140 [Leptospira santarosai str. HAI1380]
MILRKMLSKIIDSIRISSEFFFICEKFLMSLGKNFVYQVRLSNRI